MQTAINYAKAMAQLNLPEEAAKEALQIYRDNPPLKKALENPVLPKQTKYRIVEQVFPGEMVNVCKVLCQNGHMAQFEQVMETYELYRHRKAGVLHAVLTYVTPPKEEQLQEIKQFLCREMKVGDVAFTLKQKKELIGGFILYANGIEYDYSLKGRLQKIQQKLVRR
jgi:F-type H+-transporting ATPase subunit delta